MIGPAMRSRAGNSTMSPAIALLLCSMGFTGCSDLSKDDVTLSKRERSLEVLHLGQRFPDQSEAATIGPLIGRIRRNGQRFAGLVRADDDNVLFKDEERSGADRLMTPRLRSKLEVLSTLVSREWTGLRLRVTEAWDETGEHTGQSVHYEGRAADITTSDVDPQKLGRLAGLAVTAGFDWVFYEDTSHVHVSVRP